MMCVRAFFYTDIMQRLRERRDEMTKEKKKITYKYTNPKCCYYIIMFYAYTYVSLWCQVKKRWRYIVCWYLIIGYYNEKIKVKDENKNQRCIIIIRSNTMTAPWSSPICYYSINKYIRSVNTFFFFFYDICSRQWPELYIYIYSVTSHARISN